MTIAYNMHLHKLWLLYTGMHEHLLLDSHNYL